MTLPPDDQNPDRDPNINIDGNVEGHIVNIGGQIIMNQPASSSPQPADPRAKPRVFISYARADGEEFATDLRKKLETQGIPLWQDRARMEGGRDWWLQIAEAIETVEFMVLVMTPTAMKSMVVRKEWRYARQQGICVYPVKAAPNLDFGSLPRWMRDAHFYDLDHEWTKFTQDLNQHCEVRRVPFMVEDLPRDFVPRPGEFDAIIRQLLDAKHEEPVAITAALRGAGGYGKTTLARAICHQEEIQQAFDDGVLWVTLGERPENLIGKIEDLIYVINGKRPGANSIETATAELVKVLEDRDILIVIDDVWRSTDLKPFVQGGKRCARLITTRNSDVLPAEVQKINVDAMTQSEAVQLLSNGLPAMDSGSSAALAKRLGEWPLLLKLANGTLRDRVGKGQTVTEALEWVNKALDKRGLTAFDPKNPNAFDPHDSRQRNQAVSATLGVSLDLLSADERTRYLELAIFPEDVVIPLETVTRLWGATGGLDDFDSEELCDRLDKLSLLLKFDPASRTIELHDIVRAYLQELTKGRLADLHVKLVDSYGLNRWADLSPSEPYLWDWLIYHLLQAGRHDELLATARDLRYAANKISVRGTYSVEADLLLADALEKQTALFNNVPLPVRPFPAVLRLQLAKMGHILNRCHGREEVTATLCSRLQHVLDLAEASAALEKELARPYLRLWRDLPDLPHPALIRTLTGHKNRVRACAVSFAGNFIVSCSDDRTLKVWDMASGAERLTLSGHDGNVYGCAVSPRGDFIVSASDDGTLKIWDAVTGGQRLTLKGYQDAVYACAVSPDGDFIVSGSSDRTLRLWDVQTGAERLSLIGHEGAISACAVSPDGQWIVSAGGDGTLRVWDINARTERLTLSDHGHSVYDCAVSRDGKWIVSAGADRTLKMWDAASGELLRTLDGHASAVLGCAISSDGNLIASASYDRSVKVWEAATGKELLSLVGHTDTVYDCAFDFRDWVISASEDRLLKVWNAMPDPLTMQATPPPGYTAIVRGCAISPAGDFAVSAAEDGTVRKWNVTTGEQELVLTRHNKEVVGCTVSADGGQILSASWDNTIRVWDASSGAQIRVLEGTKTGVFGQLNACAISPRGDFIVGASQQNVVEVWDTRSGHKRATYTGHVRYVHSCAVSPSGEYIASAGEDRMIIIWQVKTGFKIRTFGSHDAGVRCCAFSPSGKYLVSASLDRTLKVYDTENWTERMTLSGHAAGVLGCAISPHEDWILSVAADGSLKAWDVQTGQCLASLFVDGVLYCCAVHPDGEHMIAGGAGGLYWLRLIR